MSQGETEAIVFSDKQKDKLEVKQRCSLRGVINKLSDGYSRKTKN